MTTNIKIEGSGVYCCVYYIEPNVFEETEGIELLRVIGANINLHGVELEFENRSVDTPEDLEFVRNAIITDQLFHKYKHKVKS